MFALAYELASEFTRPVIVSHRTYDGRAEAGIASYVILNEDGWILTAAHVFGHLQKQHSDAAPMEEYQRMLMDADQKGLSSKQRKAAFGNIKPNYEWITHTNYWFGSEEIRVEPVHLIDGDLGIARLSGPWVRPKKYPTLKNPNHLQFGRSLCRFGFPLVEVPCQFDESAQRFLINASQGLPLFPLDGILTREIQVTGPNGAIAERYIETSTPGLKGQSGGPIVDAQGVVWGIQSRTQHHLLGFEAALATDGATKVSQQVLNVGWGVHPRTIVDSLTHFGIAFSLAD